MRIKFQSHSLSKGEPFQHLSVDCIGSTEQKLSADIAFALLIDGPDS